MTRALWASLLSLAFSFTACGDSHEGEGPGGPPMLGTTPGPWCGEDGSWRLIIDLEAIDPIEYDVEVNDSVFFGIDESCSFRWASDTDICIYNFEIVCASPDIRRTDECRMHLTSNTHMEGDCTQTVESAGTTNTYEGTGTAEFLPARAE